MKTLLDEVDRNRRVIKHEVLTFSLSELVNMYHAKPPEVNINPTFQRLFRWTREQQSSFLESLILEIPIPPLFFYEREDGVWELLDGLQRFSTILRFFATGEIPAEAAGPQGNDNEWHDDHENDLDAPLQLLAGEYLTQLLGLSFGTLPSQLQLNLKRARLQIYILKRETDQMYKYEIFKRLNRGGTEIADQEIRNCSVRMLSDEFPDFLQKVAEDGNFVLAVGISEEQQKRGYLQELALRFFATKNDSAHFTHDVSAFLTDYMQGVARTTAKFDQSAEEKVFKEVWKVIAEAMPNGVAFQGKTEDDRSFGPFSPALFEMISVGIAKNLDAAKRVGPTELKKKITELIKEAKQQGLTGSGSNSRKKFNKRLELGEKRFS
jgi:hypothetical protein